MPGGFLCLYLDILKALTKYCLSMEYKEAQAALVGILVLVGGIP